MSYNYVNGAQESPGLVGGTVVPSTSTAIEKNIPDLDVPQSHVQTQTQPQPHPHTPDSANSMSPDSVTNHPDHANINLNISMKNVTIPSLELERNSVMEIVRSRRPSYDGCQSMDLGLELGIDAQEITRIASSKSISMSKSKSAMKAIPIPIPLSTKTTSDESNSSSQENISPNSCMNGMGVGVLSRSAENLGKSFGKSILGIQAPVPAIQIPAGQSQLLQQHHHQHPLHHDNDDASLEEPRGETFCLTPPTPAKELCLDEAVAYADASVEEDEDRDDASTTLTDTHTHTNSPPFMPDLHGGDDDSGDGDGDGDDNNNTAHAYDLQAHNHITHEDKSVRSEQSQISLTPRRGRCFAEDDDGDGSLLASVSASASASASAPLSSPLPDHNPNKDTIDTEHATKKSKSIGKKKKKQAASTGASATTSSRRPSPSQNQNHKDHVDVDDDEPNLAGENFIDVGEAMSLSMHEAQDDGYENEHEHDHDHEESDEEYMHDHDHGHAPLNSTESAMDESYEWSRMACECENAGDYSSALHYYEMCWDLICFASPYNADVDEEDNRILIRDHCRRMASMLKSIGTLQWKSGAYQRSLKVLTMSRTTIVEAISFCSPFDQETYEMKEDLCEVLNTIGRVYLSLGKPDESLRYHKKSLSILTSLYTGKNNDDSDRWDADAMVVDNGDLYGDHGYDSDQERSSRGRDRNGNKQPSSPDMSQAKKVAHPAVARAIILIGVVQSSRGHYSTAMSNFKEGLILQRQVLGSCHVDIAATMNAIGALYEKTGQLEKAMQCYKKARKIYTQQLGENHVDYAVTMNNIGQIYHQIGKHKKAMQVYREALRVTRQVLGRSHRNIASILYNMGLVHLQCHQFDKASKMFKDTLRVQRESLGDFHVDVALTLEVLGGIYERRRKIDKALQLYHKALRIRQTVSSDDICVAIALDRIGKCQLNFTVDIRESIEYFDEALQIYRINGVAEDDPLVLHVIRNLSRASNLLEEEEQKKRRLR